MPSSMIHLFVAKRIDPSAKIDFYIGSIAPDAVLDADKKTQAHLRSVPDREAALRELALGMDMENEYVKGFILHLFVDLKWDDIMIADFAKKEGKDWFPRYRDEIGRATAYAFHHTEWSCDLWDQMELCEISDFVKTDFISREDVKLLIHHQRKWQMENDLGPSSAFPPEIIDDFVDKVANDFMVWLSSLVA